MALTLEARGLRVNFTVELHEQNFGRCSEMSCEKSGSLSCEDNRELRQDPKELNCEEHNDICLVGENELSCDNKNNLKHEVLKVFEQDIQFDTFDSDDPSSTCEHSKNMYETPMEENDGQANVSNSYRPQDTYQRTQENPIEYRVPNTTGVVPVPRGSRGPRSLYLKRNGDSFGFTLRHFIVYPPDSVAEHHDGRHAAVGALLEPMDTIFVKYVKDRSPAKQAGLQRGDRLVAVNGVSIKDKSYSQVVQLIVNSPDYLHLLVVPKEEDVLQRFFADTAYNPASNQPVYQEYPSDRQSAQRILAHRLGRGAPEFQVDAVSWRSLQQPYGHTTDFTPLQRVPYERGQRSADNLLYSEQGQNQEIYAEIYPHELNRRIASRAVPQVPLYRKMGRRASEGSTLTEDYDLPEYCSVNTDNPFENFNMKTMYKSNYLPDTNDVSSLNYPNTVGCRLSLDVGRRESTSSFSSSIADGSKDSLASYDSASTLTGQETDDSAIMTRFRKSFQQKEEFLKMPTSTVEQALMREFYGRPKKLEKQIWPPNERDFPSKAPVKPIHQNFRRVKNDIDIERDLVIAQNQGQEVFGGGVAPTSLPQQRLATSPKDKTNQSFDKAFEAETAPVEYDCLDIMNGSGSEDATFAEDRRMYPPSLQQLVQKRTKDFESGRPLPEDDPSQSNRMDFSRSELARLSSKKLVPNVCERAQEYEIKREANTQLLLQQQQQQQQQQQNVLKRIQRDSRSLDNSAASNGSSLNIHEILFGAGKRLSGNVTISSGSKYLHCPLPTDWQKDGHQDQSTKEKLENDTTRMRARSNSAESWVAALGRDREGSKRRQDATTKIKTQEHALHTSPPPSISLTYSPDLSPLIPEPVERMNIMPSVSVTPASPSSVIGKAMRPNQLDLEGPIRPARQLKSSNLSVSLEDKPVVIKRRHKKTNIADDERAVRRESYLKATEGGRMHIDSDLSDGGDISPQVLRSAHRRWRPPLFPGDIQQLRKLFEDAASSLGGSASSSNASLDREKTSASPSPLEKKKFTVVREGPLHCKILEIDGKRAADRSWKQVFVMLKGPTLFLYKDRHHQSPVGTSDALDQSLANGVDMRASMVRVAEDYTKRKNVLRVSAVKPCRSEFLLQAESTEEFADWVKTLQEQVAASTEAELEPVHSKQQAVPQLVPASTTIQVQGSHLSPQLNKSKVTASRNRSPTGQSPVSKSRKPSQIPEPTSTSPKSKTWRGRMAKQFRKFNQGANSPSSPTAPEGSTFGIPLEDCLMSQNNEYLPRFVEVCTDIIDERGLQTVGIYRVPGNNASITALTEEVNKNFDDIPLDDSRWNDLHVVSSLLKSYFRKMPDSLITIQLYPAFIKADKIETSKARMEELKRLVKSLPKHNYHTLRHIILHLRRVADHSEMNRMEAKNLAIVFGPTIVRPEGENMESMVNHMTNQCKIVETLLTHAEWFFPDNDSEENLPVPILLSEGTEDFEPHNQQLLLHNISKYEALSNPKEKNGALFSSIILAAQRKVKRKPNKGGSSLTDGKDEPTSPTNLKVFPSQSFSPSDLKESTSPDCKLSESIPTTVTEIEKKNKLTEKMPGCFYYSEEDKFHERIQNFKQETEAMLQMPRRMEISIGDIDSRSFSHLSSSTTNVHQNPRLARTNDMHLLTKTHSASNVFSRAHTLDHPSRNSLSSDSRQFTEDKHRQYLADEQYSDTNKNGGGFDATEDRRTMRGNVRRGSSAENVNCGSLNVGNGNLKKVKYESETENQRTGSLESLNRLSNDDESLLSTMTKIMDEKFKEEHSPTYTLLTDDIPFADESPEKQPIRRPSSEQNKENVPHTSDLYRNPSLHKNQFISSKSAKKELKDEKEKEEDTMIVESVPDNDRLVGKLTLISNSNSNKLNTDTSLKLRRSESLNKSDKTVSPLNSKLRRSESLNKAEHKLKRSDSLTKSEKTENNLNKRRELSLNNRRVKDSTKNKRKNGTPDRSIKRRHTVGGTKDPDKVTWLLDNKNKEETNREFENKREKNLRTSSPDLSSTRRDRFVFEISLIDAETLGVLRQHLMGTRPQSFPEATAVFKVPLESHV